MHTCQCGSPSRERTATKSTMITVESDKQIFRATLKGRHVLSIRDLTAKDIESIFSLASDMEKIVRDRRCGDLLRGKIMTTLFFQPSTRTRLSFESAMFRLGGSVLTFGNPEDSRAGGKWGETLADTARVMDSYADLVVIRHPEVGAAKEFAQYANVPVINGGDGEGPGAEHPTQALLDLYTISKVFGQINGITMLLVGGMQIRVGHSLLLAFARFFDARLLIHCPDSLWLSKDEEAELRMLGLNYRRVESMEEALPEADVIYHNGWKESGPEPIPDKYRITAAKLTRAPKHAIVMDALPRVGVTPDVDATPHARYFEQAWNGVPIRMALLAHLLG